VVQERKRQNGKRNQSQYDHRVEVPWIGHAPLLRSLTISLRSRCAWALILAPHLTFRVYPLNRCGKLMIV
jgi:hypothetical protein